MLYPEFLFPMIYEFVIYFFTLLMVIVIGKRYTERKKPPIRYMFYFSLFMSFAILMAAFSRVLRYTGLWIISIIQNTKLEFLAFTISFIAVGNVFMLLFCIEVFTKNGLKGKGNLAIVIVYLFLTLGFIIFAIWTGILVEDLTTWIWGGAIVLSIFVYGWTMIAALKLAFRLKGQDKLSTFMISVSPISIMLVFVMFFIDRMVGGNFSPFYYAGWVFVIISLIFMYIGVIRPKFIFKEES